MPSSFAASRPAPISSGGCGSKCRATMTPPRGLTRAYGTAVLKLPGATIRPGVFMIWSTGVVSVAQDRPSAALALFTRANVIDGLFQYEGASLKSRHTVALVAWNDPADAYRQKI